MHGEVVGPVSDTQLEVMNELHEKYDMKSHTRADSQLSFGANTRLC